MRSPRRLAVRIALIALWLALAFFLLFPFYYALVSSLRPAADIFHASYWPDAPTLDNYRAVMTEQPFARNIFNSIVVAARSEEHTSELQSLMRISYAVFCVKQKNTTTHDVINQYSEAYTST